jgi:hypothetical protein
MRTPISNLQRELQLAGSNSTFTSSIIAPSTTPSRARWWRWSVKWGALLDRKLDWLLHALPENLTFPCSAAFVVQTHTLTCSSTKTHAKLLKMAMYRTRQSPGKTHGKEIAHGKDRDTWPPRPPFKEPL